MSRIVSCLIGILLGLPSAVSANLSDIVCDDRDRLEGQLTSAFGASKQGRGLRGPETLIEVWVDPRTGDWTLVQAYSNGTACVVAMGEHWESVAPKTDPS